MKKEVFRISGVGSALVDYLYTPVDFNGEAFKRHISVESGDGAYPPVSWFSRMSSNNSRAKSTRRSERK